MVYLLLATAVALIGVISVCPGNTITCYKCQEEAAGVDNSHCWKTSVSTPITNCGSKCAIKMLDVVRANSSKVEAVVFRHCGVPSLHQLDGCYHTEDINDLGNSTDFTRVNGTVCLCGTNSCNNFSVEKWTQSPEEVLPTDLQGGSAVTELSAVLGVIPILTFWSSSSL